MISTVFQGILLNFAIETHNTDYTRLNNEHATEQNPPFYFVCVGGGHLTLGSALEYSCGKKMSRLWENESMALYKAMAMLTKGICLRNLNHSPTFSCCIFERFAFHKAIRPLKSVGL